MARWASVEAVIHVAGLYEAEHKDLVPVLWVALDKWYRFVGVGALR